MDPAELSAEPTRAESGTEVPDHLRSRFPPEGMLTPDETSRLEVPVNERSDIFVVLDSCPGPTDLIDRNSERVLTSFCGSGR